MTPIKDTINAWAKAQTASWATRRVGRLAAEAFYMRLNESRRDVFVFRFADGWVGIDPKPQFDAQAFARADDVFVERANGYARFFQAVLEAHGMAPEGVLAMSMHDRTEEEAPFPLFAFQRRVGGPELLVPDVDALRLGFYADVTDDIPYAAKQDRAVFVGSTTGEMHSAASVAALSSQRLRSAVFFRGSAEVDFRLPRITQCQSPDAVMAIRALGFGVGAAEWETQFDYKFLLSLDGNGATCSRVAIALASHSVLVKYASPFELYYFAGLQAGTHFIAVTDDTEVAPIVRAEQAEPGRFAAVAASGRQFFQDYLTEAAARLYTAQVLERYFGCFDDAPVVREPAAVPARLSAVLHIADQGDTGFDAADWAGLPQSGQPIEGFVIAPDNGMLARDLEYRGVWADAESAWSRAGTFVGTRGASRPLQGLAVRLRSSASGLEARVSGRFVGGDSVGPVAQGAVCRSAHGAALEAFRIDLAERHEAGVIRRLGVLNWAPLVVQCEIDGLAAYEHNPGELIARAVKRPFGLIVNCVPPLHQLDERRRAALAAWLQQFRTRYRACPAWLACATTAEMTLAEQLGITGRLLDRAAFLDEAAWKRMPGVEPQFDAVYAAKMHDSSRHEMAALIERSCLGFPSPTDADARLVLQEVTRFMPQATLTELDGSQSAACRAINAGRVGLVLAADLPTHGLEYRLCGLPVVSCVEPDAGSADAPWLIRCEAAPRAVEHAVRAMVARDIERPTVRQAAIVELIALRTAWRQAVGRLCARLGNATGNTFPARFASLRADQEGLNVTSLTALAHQLADQ